jgi:hypothetical protein
LLAAADPAVLEQVVYFSTASILDRELQLLPEAMAYGTEYIQTKAQCLQQLEQHPLAERIVAVFPTLVFGGKVGRLAKRRPHPTSYLTAGPGEAVPLAVAGQLAAGRRQLPFHPRRRHRHGCAPTWPPRPTSPTPSRARARCAGWCWASRPITVNQTVRGPLPLAPRLGAARGAGAAAVG